MKPTDWRPITKGNTLTIDGVKFTAGGRKVHTYDDDDGYSVWSERCCDVVLADGTKCYGVLTFCDTDSGELWGTYLFTPDGGIWTQGVGEPLPMGKSKGDVFPYRYRYAGRMREDHHIGEDGWSR